MSANRWSLCPQCVRNARKREGELRAKAQESYGKVSPDEYDELLEQAKAAGIEPDSHTLRQDWEIGVYDERFQMWFSASCKVCGFEYRYKYTDHLVFAERSAE